MQAAEQVLCGLPMRSPICFGRGGFHGPVQVSFTHAITMQASKWQRGFTQTYRYTGAVMTMCESGLFAGCRLYWWFQSEHHAVFADGFIWKRKLDEAYNFFNVTKLKLTLLATRIASFFDKL